MIRLLKHLIGTTLIAFSLVPFAFICPVLFLIAKDPDVRIAVVFAAPFSASVLTLFYSTLSETPWREGREGVLEWREAHGGLIGSWIRGTLWAFFGLFFSFAAEVVFLFTLRFRDAHPPFAMLALPAYSPVFICWCWRKLHA
jgi:hypothetical protein